MIISKNQIDLLSHSQIKVFVNKMAHSIKDNLDIHVNPTDTNFLKELESIVVLAMEQYQITSETCLEEYLLLHYNFPVAFSGNIPIEISEILKNTYKSESMKLEELTSYILAKY